MRLWSCALACAALLAAPSSAWDVAGHKRIARAALLALPSSLPSFFREGGPTIASFAVEPDVLGTPAAGAMRGRERPDHWLDLELLGGEGLPPSRDEYLSLLAKRGVSPGAAGGLPYALVEETDALALAFAEHRRFPTDPLVQERALARAGRVAHLAGDVVQPLHTTVHYDGRLVDGRSPRSGVHLRVDALLDRAPAAEWPRVPTAERIDDPRAAVVAALAAAHALVDEVYRLEGDIPEGAAPAGVAPSVMAFARARAEAAIRLTSSLWLLAWERSAGLALEPWVVELREAEARERSAPSPAR